MHQSVITLNMTCANKMYEYEHFVCLLLRRGTGEGAAAAEARRGQLSADSTPGL